MALKRYKNYLPLYLAAVRIFLRQQLYVDARQALDEAERRFDIAGSEFATLSRSEILRHPAVTKNSDVYDGGEAAGTEIAAQRLVSTARKNRVHIYTVTFFDMEGRAVFPGGAERYLFDLIAILRGLGLDPVIYQAGTSRWKRRVRDIEVCAVTWNGSVFELSRSFGDIQDPACLHIYSPFTLAAVCVGSPSIGICHGVYWDHAGATILVDAVSRDVFSGLKHLDQCISVDANSINALNSVHPEYTKSMKYIPNYVGQEFFVKRRCRTDDRLRVLYPRRLYKPRGYWMLAEVIPDLVRQFPKVMFTFLGDADETESAHAAQLAAQFPDNVEHVSALPEDMPGYYATSDISVIPTLQSEGTSLSALEALAAGNAVISTYVGGLGNIIIDELNGLLIEPNADALKAAIARLIEDAELRQRLANFGRISAEAFSKEKWSRSWRAVLEPYGQDGSWTSGDASNRPLSVVHPCTDGIMWDDESEQALPRQRPHHLMAALGELGCYVTFISDHAQKRPIVTSDGRVEILDRGSKVYVDDAVVYVYYAYHLWALGEIGEALLSTLSASERAPFDSTREGHGLARAKVWFDLIDDPSLHNNALYARAVELFIQNAHIVSTSSRLLLKKYRSVRPDMILVENASWPDHFLPRAFDVRTSKGEGVRIKSTGAKIIGYVGAIADWFDFELVADLAVAYPFDEIVVVGPIADSVADKAAKLASFPNVRLLGKTAYNRVPGLVRQFDVAILPFRRNAITDATNPLKLYEYMSAGVPVVTTGLEEISLITGRQNPAYLRIAQTTADFLREVGTLLRSEMSAQIAIEARQFALSNTWRHRAAVAVERLRSSLSSGPARSGWAGRRMELQAFNADDALRAPSILIEHREPLRIRFDRTVKRGDTFSMAFPLYTSEPGFYRLDFELTACSADYGVSAPSFESQLFAPDGQRHRFGWEQEILRVRLVGVVRAEQRLDEIVLKTVCLKDGPPGFGFELSHLDVTQVSARSASSLASEIERVGIFGIHKRRTIAVQQ
ncbi:MAG: hypothetical protein B7Z68_03160 [Acidobacteria bacterium 21-70-11]|nr:MAG: hypothetical protein B7Z68_03160 [Acidobacteria bacterium 21-70-11]